MTSQQNRRQDERHQINHEFSSVDQFISEYVTNISRTGVFIRSEAPLPVGTRVGLRFTVILDDLETVEGIGEVVRMVAPGGTESSGMGVVFTELTQMSQALVERVMVRRTSPGEQG